jgi:hypothetical protein
MGKRITSLGLLLLVSFYMIAQENATQSINEIKRQSDIYLYAESTSQTWEEALDNAKYLLGVEIETWAKTIDAKHVDGYIAEAQNHILNLKSMRGNRFRAFVYVKKSDIMPIVNASQVLVISADEERKTTISEVNTRPTEVLLYQPTQLEKEIMSVSNANNIGTFIKRLKSEGRLGNYGKYKDMPSDIDCYLFVYNRELEISAYLHKTGNKHAHQGRKECGQQNGYEHIGRLGCTHLRAIHQYAYRNYCKARCVEYQEHYHGVRCHLLPVIEFLHAFHSLESHRGSCIVKSQHIGSDVHENMPVSRIVLGKRRKEP